MIIMTGDLSFKAHSWFIVFNTADCVYVKMADSCDKFIGKS